MSNETINSRSGTKASLDNDVVDYVRAVFEQVNRNQQDWGVQNAQVLAKLQQGVKDLETEVANLKGRL